MRTVTLLLVLLLALFAAACSRKNDEAARQSANEARPAAQQAREANQQATTNASGASDQGRRAADEARAAGQKSPTAPASAARHAEGPQKEADTPNMRDEQAVSRSSESEARINLGKSLFASKCAGCHKSDASGNPAIKSPSIKGVAPAVIRNAFNTKPPHAGVKSMDDAQIAAISAYLHTL